MANRYDKQRKLQERYGAAPQAFEDHVITTLRSIEEGKPVRRFTIRTVLIAALILGLMTGLALAVANSLGVLGIIERGTPISEEAKQEIQTEFVQSGGDLTNVSARVRDAVSDGRTLFLSIEMKAKNPDDALLLTYDAFDWTDEEARTTRLQWLERASVPNWEAIREDQQVHYVVPYEQVHITAADGTDADLPINTNWRYEALDTLVFHAMIDLQPLSDPRQMLQLTFTPTLGKKADAEVTDINGYALSPIFVPFDVLEDATLTVEVLPGTMESRTAVADTPFDFTDFTFERLEVTTTPLAMYLTIVDSVRPERKEQRSAGYIVCDLEGKRYEDLAIVHQFTSRPNADGSWDGVPRQWVYERKGDLPEAILLRAMEMYGRDSNVPLENDLTVGLTEVTAGEG